MQQPHLLNNLFSLNVFCYNFVYLTLCLKFLKCFVDLGLKFGIALFTSYCIFFNCKCLIKYLKPAYFLFIKLCRLIIYNNRIYFSLRKCLNCIHSLVVLFYLGILYICCHYISGSSKLNSYALSFQICR